MEFHKLNASLVNGSGMTLTDESEIVNEVISLYENEIDDYALLDYGDEICLKLLGDDIRPPWSCFDKIDT